MMVPGLNDLVYVAGSYRMDLSSGLGLAGSYSSLSVRWSQRHEWTLPMMLVPVDDVYALLTCRC